MIIKNLTMNTILTITFLISHSHAWNMEKPTSTYKNPCLAIIPYAEFNLKKLIKAYNADNTEYNTNNSPLVSLSLEMLEAVLSKISSLEGAMETASALRRTCTTFNELPLEHFGKAYQHYPNAKKYGELFNLLNKLELYTNDYWNRRYGALILILAGTEDPKGYGLIDRIINNNDQEAAAIYANSHQKSHGYPLLYKANHEILKIFINNEVDLNQAGYSLPNILCSNISFNNPSAELIELYLNYYHINPEKIKTTDGNYLLHYLVLRPAYSIKERNNYVKISELLLNKAPKLVNSLNKKGKTPIDSARQGIKDYAKDSPGVKSNKQLITLFKQYGGKTAKELKQDQEQCQNLINQLKADYSRE